MTVISKLQETMKKVKLQIVEAEEELKKLEEEFSNVKLNPYGVTSIDFSKRQELTSDLLKMEGVIMGLTLAVETLTGVEEGATAE